MSKAPSDSTALMPVSPTTWARRSGGVSESIGDVDGPRFQDGQHAHHEQRAAAGHDADAVPALDAGRPQDVGQLVQTSLELGVGQCRAGADDGERVRARRSVRGNLLVHEQVGSRGARFRPPRAQDGSLALRDHPQVAEPTLSAVDDRRQRLLEVAEEPGCSPRATGAARLKSPRASGDRRRKRAARGIVARGADRGIRRPERACHGTAPSDSSRPPRSSRRGAAWLAGTGAAGSLRGQCARDAGSRARRAGPAGAIRQSCGPHSTLTRVGKVAISIPTMPSTPRAPSSRPDTVVPKTTSLAPP